MMTQYPFTGSFTRYNVSLPEMVEKLWESTTVGFTLVGPDGCWIRPSPFVCDLLGRTRDELETLTYKDVTHPLDIEFDLRMAREVIEGSLPYYTIEKRYITKGQATVWVRLYVTALFENGVRMFFVQISKVDRLEGSGRPRTLALSTDTVPLPVWEVKAQQLLSSRTFWLVAVLISLLSLSLAVL